MCTMYTLICKIMSENQTEKWSTFFRSAWTPDNLVICCLFPWRVPVIFSLNSVIVDMFAASLSISSSIFLKSCFIFVNNKYIVCEINKFNGQYQILLTFLHTFLQFGRIGFRSTHLSWDSWGFICTKSLFCVSVTFLMVSVALINLL